MHRPRRDKNAEAFLKNKQLHIRQILDVSRSAQTKGDP